MSELNDGHLMCDIFHFLETQALFDGHGNSSQNQMSAQLFIDGAEVVIGSSEMMTSVSGCLNQ